MLVQELSIRNVNGFSRNKMRISEVYTVKKGACFLSLLNKDPQQ